jgi:uncharacterized protein YqhQ
MEGVLMRSPNFWGLAVRTPTGELDLRAERFRSVTRRSRLFRLPVIRGALSLGETLWLGMKALTLSTNIALGEEEDLSKKEIAATLGFALALGLGLFLVAPVLGTKGIGSFLGASIENPVLFNLVEGALRIAIFIAYLLGITLISKDVKRFFAYHGAEHKAIKVYERGEELVLSILVFSLLGVEGWLFMVLSRLIVIPLVAGIAFEFIMWSARHQENPVVRILVWPGLQLQKLTTREPTDGMVEVAMASLKKVLSMEEEAKIEKDEATNKLVI